MGKTKLFFKQPEVQGKIGLLLAFLAVKTESEIDNEVLEGISVAAEAAQEAIALGETDIEDLVKALIGLFGQAADLTENEADDLVADVLKKAADAIGDYSEAFKDATAATATAFKLLPLVIEAINASKALRDDKPDDKPEEPKPSVNGTAKKASVPARETAKASKAVKSAEKAEGKDDNALAK